MGYLVIAIAVFLLAVLAGCSGIKSVSKPKDNTASSSTVEKAKSSQREDIQQRLQKLADSKAPKLSMKGAMCYVSVIVTENWEYICPKCGEKTIHKQIYGAKDGLDSCRRAAKEIKKLHVKLDESQFCRKCSPDVENPRLALLVYYEGEERPHRIENIGLRDLILIRQFLSGSKKYTDEYDKEWALKNYSKRLSDLLGVEIELPEKESK